MVINPPHWQADLLPGFEQTELTAGPAADAPVCVLVRRRGPTPARGAVLYIHGFVDYFFQTHLADFYQRQGLDFYALDLRRHGRALRPGQLPNYTTDVDEYLADLDAAISVLREQEGVRHLLLNGHSTGGLVAALYAHRGQYRAQVDSLFLNSPFLDMNIPAWQARLFEPALAALGASFPLLQLPGLSAVYGQSIRADFHGEWSYKEEWKPLGGFPVRAGWFRAIHRAQAEVARGLSIDCPCLVLHAERSMQFTTWEPAAMTADTVLNVDDMRRLAPRLGSQVEVRAIENGMHDLTLSSPVAREQLWGVLEAWLQRTALATPPAA